MIYWFLGDYLCYCNYWWVDCELLANVLIVYLLWLWGVCLGWEVCWGVIFDWSSLERMLSCCIWITPGSLREWKGMLSCIDLRGLYSRSLEWSLSSKGKPTGCLVSVPCSWTSPVPSTPFPPLTLSLKSSSNYPPYAKYLSTYSTFFSLFSFSFNPPPYLLYSPTHSQYILKL